MGTSFEEIYKLFLAKIKSYELFALTDFELEGELAQWLELAVASFGYHCYQDIVSVDMETGYFDVTLNLQEKNILATYMVYHFVSMHLVNMEANEQVLNSRDYRMYSEANYLEAKSKLRDRVQREITSLKSHYSYFDKGRGKL
mgnify:FL=1